MIPIQAWQADLHPGKLDLSLLIWTEKGILKLYTVLLTDGESSDSHSFFSLTERLRNRNFSLMFTAVSIVSDVEKWTD